MNKKIIVLLIFTALVIFGCTRMEYGLTQSESGRLFSARSGLLYDDSVLISRNTSADTLWEGSAGIEGHEPPRFRDMSNDGSDITAANPNADERKLVKMANVQIKLENFDTTDEFISNLLERHNAYSALTQINEHSRFYSLRVPSKLFDVFLTEVNNMGNLISRHESTEDVTVRYYDLEGRLETQKELLRTFQSYLGRTNTMQDILTVETRIADLQRDIDRTGSQLRSLANLVDYATINLNLHMSVPVVSYKGETLSDRIRDLFSGFGNFLSSILVAIIGFVIYGIPLLAIIVLLIWVLFGRIGLMKKLWNLLMSKKQS
ncbi:MAG: DUF4349 domain-containing protein [Treponema sp.]|nr:DUF4349 domain-containing protein [Treponema sp.]